MSDKDHNTHCHKKHAPLKSQIPPKWARWSIIIVALFTTLSAASPDQNLMAQSATNLKARQISKLFTGPDGTHLNLAIIIQAGLSNLDSFQHQQTTYVDKGEYLVVNMHYQAEGASGEAIDRFARAKVDFTGKVISILENR